jgi:hypothetical protein
MLRTLKMLGKLRTLITPSCPLQLLENSLFFLGRALTEHRLSAHGAILVFLPIFSISHCAALPG